MKTSLSLLFAAASTGLVFAQPAPQTDTAAVERQPLERWLGDWTYESTTHASPLGAGDISLGAYSIRSIVEEQFTGLRGKESREANQQWVDAEGFDLARGTYFWNSFGKEGTVTDATYTFDGPRVAMTGTLLVRGERYKLRSTVTFADDFQSLTDKREISTDGVNWTLLSESHAAKVMSALAAPDTAPQEPAVMASETEQPGVMENKCLPNSLQPQ